MPGGCEAAVMGLYQFCGTALTWAPALLIGAWRELTGSLIGAMAPIAAMQLSAAACIAAIDVTRAQADIAGSLKLRRWSVAQPAPQIHPTAAPDDGMPPYCGVGHWTTTVGHCPV